MPSALIIGSGVSGLTSGVLLAEHGWQVTILESHAIPGGLMQRFRRGAYWFDTGFHFITGGGPGGPFRPLAQRLGILDHIHFLQHDEAHQFRVHLPQGGHVDLPAGLDHCERACATHWADQAAGISRFFAELRGCLASKPWLAMLVPDGTPPPTVDTDLSVNVVLDQCGVSGEPKAVLGCLTGILAMKPDSCPLGLYAAFAGTSISGSWRAKGGGSAVISPLVERFKALGGALLMNRGAERIHHNDRDVEAVEDVKGQRHTADLILATCHPAEILRLTGDGGLRPSLVERIRDTPDSISVVSVYAALSRPATGLGRIHHFGRLGDVDGLYYLSPSNFYDAPADDQAATANPPYVEAMLWVPGAEVAQWRGSEKGRRPAEYEAWKRKMEADLLGGVIAHHPEIAGTITRTWSSSPLSVEYYVRSRGGGAMGLSHDIGHLGTDPMPRRSRLKNLFFAGQNVGHPGVLGAMIDGFVMAGSFIGKDLSTEVLAGAGPTR